MIELETLRNTIDCCRVHIRASADDKVWLNCLECGDTRFCKKVAALVGKELEMRIAFINKETG